MYVGYWQPQVPAPVTSERSVAFDGLAEPEPEPEFDELVWCVGAAGVWEVASTPFPSCFGYRASPWRSTA